MRGMDDVDIRHVFGVILLASAGKVMARPLHNPIK